MLFNVPPLGAFLVEILDDLPEGHSLSGREDKPRLGAVEFCHLPSLS